MSEAFKNLEAILTDLRSFSEKCRSSVSTKKYFDDEIRSALEELGAVEIEIRYLKRANRELLSGIEDLIRRYRQWEDRETEHQSRSQGQKR